MILHFISSLISPKQLYFIPCSRVSRLHKDITICVKLIGYDLDLYLFMRATLKAQKGRVLVSHFFLVVIDRKPDMIDLIPSEIKTLK